MKMQGRKAIAFWTTLIVIMVMAILSLVFSPDTWGETSKWILVAILINSIVFISFTVIKDFIKSKYFQEGLNGDKPKCF